jgi:hypothetical protein
MFKKTVHMEVHMKMMKLTLVALSLTGMACATEAQDSALQELVAVEEAILQATADLRIEVAALIEAAELSIAASVDNCGDEVTQCDESAAHVDENEQVMDS